MKNELLIRMQDMSDQQGIILIAATNRPYDLDPALRRRFDKMIYVTLPDKLARKRMLQIHVGGDVSLSSHEFERLAEITEGFSGADINILVRDALMSTVRFALRAEYFKKMNDGSYIACENNIPGTERMNTWQIQDPNRLRLAPVTFSDFISIELY
jgi:vacuolar protein-sorting-associated protein 4